MDLGTRIAAFERLGQEITNLSDAGIAELTVRAENENRWFTPENVSRALKGISFFLNGAELRKWILAYELTDVAEPKSIGVAMAGNIPLVGFHDALCVLISGNKLRAKLSSQDSWLMKSVMEFLVRMEPRFADMISFPDRLNGVDAIIATGGNNTARYFEYYFRSIPHMIRKNRASCAILSGDEKPEDLLQLGEDVFSYFGLGCRSISKLFVPEGYDFNSMLFCWENYRAVVHHNKYANNYDYQRSILLVNKIPFYDNGNILLKEDAALVSPVSLLFYEFYTSIADLREKIKMQENNLQCIASLNGWFKGSVAFGTSQCPAVSDYADGTDTIKFLEALN